MPLHNDIATETVWQEDGDETQEPKGFSVRNLVISVVLSLVVLLVVGYFTFEPETFGQLVGQLNPWLMAAAVGTVVVRVLFGAWRLQYVARGRLTFMQSLHGQLAWDFFSNVTPSAIGGGPVATVYIARDAGLRVGEVTAFMLFLMLLDQFWLALTIPLILLSALWIPIIPTSLGAVGTWAFLLYFVGMLAWVVLFGYATLYRPDLIQRFVDVVFRLKWLRRFREPAARELKQLRHRARILRGQPPSFYINGFLLTLGTWIGRYLLVVFIIWSVFPELDKFLALMRTLALTLGSIILPTPGGSGGLEGLYALFIGPLMPKAVVAPTLFAWRFLGYYIFIALGVYLSMHQVQKTLRRRREAAHEAAQAGDGQRNGTPVVEAERMDA